MATDAGLRVVGTIRTIELHTMATRFEHVTSRQVAKIQLDIERAIDEEGEELDVDNLVDLSFQAPADLLPPYAADDPAHPPPRAASRPHTTTIRPAPQTQLPPDRALASN